MAHTVGGGERGWMSLQGGGATVSLRRATSKVGGKPGGMFCFLFVEEDGAGNRDD